MPDKCLPFCFVVAMYSPVAVRLSELCHLYSLISNWTGLQFPSVILLLGVDVVELPQTPGDDTCLQQVLLGC